MNDSEKALNQLNLIREMMEKATVYRALSAPAAIFGGLLAVLLGLYFLLQDKNGEFVDGAHYFWTWVVALIIADSFNALLLFKRAKREGSKFISSGVKLTILRTAPAAIAGAIISFEAAKNDIELCTLVWILCYGAALLAMGEVAPRSLKRLGWSFIVFGTLFFLIWMKFKAALSPVLGIGYLGSASIMMIATFGILHIGHGIGVLIRKGKN
ncbi:MAG: hypothetical protein VXW02_11135 [Verrucomicrobiota bacterium]|nr:hypothetical protein [Verrucomicrobiota bacterium]